MNDANAEDQRDALRKIHLDLTQRARDGKLDPVIGRDDEIRLQFRYCNADQNTTLC